jgi:hypothetical protein
VAWSAVFIGRTAVEGLGGERVFCLFDDAMISMRYAWNLAHGHGLVWNPGERVEGYSNLLQTLLMAALIAGFGKSGGVLAVQVMGVAVLVTFGLFALRFAQGMAAERGVPSSPWWNAVYLAAALAYYPLAYWTLLGMETGLVGAAIVAASWYALASPAGRVSRPLVVAAGIALLARVDGLLPVAVVLAFRTGGAPRDRRGLTACLVEAASVAAIAAAALAFRVLYYGEWVPNTYTLKVEGYAVAFRLAEGWRFVVPFLGTVALPLGVAVVGLILRPGRWVALPVALFGTAVVFQVWVGGDAWDYWRFLAGSVPLLVLTAATEARALVAGSLRRRQDLVVLALLLAMAWRSNARFAPEIAFASPVHDVEGNWRAARVGLALREVTTGAATVGVFRAGATVYFAERSGVDFLGKSDPYIARLRPDISSIEGLYGMRTVPGHNKYDLAYSILHRRPTYIERWFWGSQLLAPQASGLYVRAYYKGVRLHLLRDSPDVRWEALDEVRPLLSKEPPVGR